MEKKFKLIIFGFLVLSLVPNFVMTSPAFATTATGDDSIEPAALPSVVSNIPVNCVVDSGLDVVAMDTSKGGTWGDHQILGQDLIDNGFTVRTTSVESGDVPSCVVKLFIHNIGSGCFGSDYSATAVNRVVDFATNGGGVFINHENSGCDNYVNPISSALGVTDLNTIGSPNPNILLEGTNFLDGNPVNLWNGVDEWFLIGYTELASSVETVATFGAFPAGNSALEALDVGDGCVLVTTDSNWSTDAFIGNNDNRQFALNGFLHLNACIADVAVGGSDVSINTSALLLAGVESISMWMIPVVIAGIGIGIFVIKRRN